MRYQHIEVERGAGDGRFCTITMNRPERRNTLSLAHLVELRSAFAAVGESDADGVVLAGAGPVFCSGHDFGELAGADLEQVRTMLSACTELMETIQSIGQVVVARVHGLATAAGCQLVASCDLAVASTEASFALPGGRGGWFCTTPLVAVGRAVQPKRAMELALCGDAIDAETALEWGLVNRVVAPDDLEAATEQLLVRATRGSPSARAMGKQAFYKQMSMPQQQAYAYAVEVMASASQIGDAQEGIAAFLEKRPANWS